MTDMKVGYFNNNVISQATDMYVTDERLLAKQFRHETF